ncbi:MAG: accessory factor UbiK family protein [Micavibrio sp.]
MKIPGPDPKMLDDLARVAGGAVNVLSGLQDQIRNDVRARMEEMATRLDLVPRDELDQAKGMIAKLRTQVQSLENRVALLEGGHKKSKPKTTIRPVVGAAGKAKAKPAGRVKNKSKPSTARKKK